MYYINHLGWLLVSTLTPLLSFDDKEKNEFSLPTIPTHIYKSIDANMVQQLFDILIVQNDHPEKQYRLLCGFRHFATTFNKVPLTEVAFYIIIVILNS